MGDCFKFCSLLIKPELLYIMGKKTKEKTYQPVNFYGDPKSVLDRISKNQLSSNAKILKFVSKKQSLFFSSSQSSYVIRIQMYQTSIQVLKLGSEILNKTNQSLTAEQAVATKVLWFTRIKSCAYVFKTKTRHDYAHNGKFTPFGQQITI